MQQKMDNDGCTGGFRKMFSFYDILFVTFSVILMFANANKAGMITNLVSVERRGAGAHLTRLQSQGNLSSCIPLIAVQLWDKNASLV